MTEFDKATSYLEGWNARKNGYGRLANPYEPGNPKEIGKYTSWCSGWYDRTVVEDNEE